MKRKKQPWKILTIITLLVASLVLGFLIGTLGLGITTIKTAEKIPETSLPSATNISLYDENYIQSPAILEPTPIMPVGNSPTLGDPDKAKITMIEFTDFQCPFCKKYYDESYSKIIEKYVKTNKVLYAFRDFPLRRHPQALLAAYAGNCAYFQNKFWEMYNLLLERQKQWSGNVSAKEIFINYAKELNLDLTGFQECLDKEKPLFEVNQDILDGLKFKVAGTPTFFINTQKLTGAQTFETISAVIDAELAKAALTQQQAAQSEEILPPNILDFEAGTR